MSLRAAGDTMTPKNINFHAYRVGYYIIRTYIRIYTRGTRENFRIWCHMCPKTFHFIDSFILFVYLCKAYAILLSLNSEM